MDYSELRELIPSAPTLLSKVCIILLEVSFPALSLQASIQTNIFSSRLTSAHCCPEKVKSIVGEGPKMPRASRVPQDT